jgi:hypothetical protein
MSTFPEDDTTDNDLDHSTLPFNVPSSQSLPLHISNYPLPEASNSENSEGLIQLDLADKQKQQKSGELFYNDTGPNVTFGSTISFSTTKVNACDIALAIEDPFAISTETATFQDKYVYDNSQTALISAPMEITSTLPPNNDDHETNEPVSCTNDVAIELQVNSEITNAHTEVHEIDYQDKSVPVKEIVVDTCEDAVLSLSSSRRIPVTAETAITADSSPSLQRGPTQYIARSNRYSEPERHGKSNTNFVDTNESVTSVHAERPVDIHSITDNILAASACIADDAIWSNEIPFHLDNNSNKPLHCNGEKRFRLKRPRPGSGNCPIRLNAYLKERYIAAPAMIFQFTDCPPDDTTLHVFERQIVHIPWDSPGQQAMSETPCIRTMLHFCYMLTAWLHTNNTSVDSMSSARTSRRYNGPIAIICCNNGKTRTAIALSCYLKYAGNVDNVQSGFCHFLERRCSQEMMTRSPESVLSDLPPSLHTFFRNFDAAIELGGYMNRKPLLLKAITIQGVPLEEQPCIDVWDSSGHHVYSSHPHLWTDLIVSDIDVLPNILDNNIITSRWADEEGFFLVNRIVQGDFIVLCRFGGAYAPDYTDASKILFRYANTTGFMGAASPYELQCHHVDLQRRYIHYFDDEDFLLSILFDAHWSSKNEKYQEILSQDCANHTLPAIVFGTEAKELGWYNIALHHTAKPLEDNVLNLAVQSLGELDGCPDHLLSLALQLANLDYTMAQTILLEGRLRSWWQPQMDDLSAMVNDDMFYSQPTILDELKCLSPTETIENMDYILNDVTVGAQESLNLIVETTTSDSQSFPDKLISTSTSERAKSEAFYVSPIMRPNAGDVTSVLHTSRVSTIFHRSDSSFFGDLPLFPVIPRRRKRGNPVLIETPENNTVMEFLLNIDHPGVYLEDLINLKNVLSISAKLIAQEIPISVDEVNKYSLAKYDVVGGTSHGNGLDELQGDHISGLELRMKNGLKSLPYGAVDSAVQVDGVDISVLDLDPEKSLAKSISTDDIDIPIKDDPAFQKYFKMKKMGLPDGAVRNAMQRDGVDSSMLDLDPEKSYKSQTTKANTAVEDVPIKDDPAFQKYFKMKKMGLPDGAVRNAMQRDGVDTSILDLNPEKSLKSQTKSIPDDDIDIPIKDDPTFQKYFKMKKMGLPDGAVRNAMQRDGVDTSVLDLDPEKSLKSQTKSIPDDVIDIPIEDDPTFQKYFKMKMMGLPDGAVRNAMQRDGVDTSILDLNPEKSLKSQTKSIPDDDIDIPIKDDPTFQKYFNMKKMGLPDGAVRNAMQRDGVDTSVLDLDPEMSVKSQTTKANTTLEDLPIKDDPTFQKYFKMKKMGLPDGAVRNAMIKDGLDPTILDLDQSKSVLSQRPVSTQSVDVILQDDPEWSMYFKMLKMGLPLGAAKNAAERDGKDPSILDLDPRKSIHNQSKAIPPSNPMFHKKKKPVKRKKIFWNPLNSGQIKANSLWSHVKGRMQMSQLKYDEKEFADLFTESADLASTANIKSDKQNKSKAKKSVQVIDGKRSMNGGIILARLKMEYGKIAEMVDHM